jgi:mannose-1-phosphate guanylyltransferase
MTPPRRDPDDAHGHAPVTERRARDRRRHPIALGSGQAPFVTVIMAGGQGQRFWPLSTPERPKQFLDLERTGRTLLQATFDRLLPLAGDVSNVYVATASRYLALVSEQLPELPIGNLLVEPVARDSGPAIALAMLRINERHPDSVVGVFSSDHRIADVPAFQLAVRDTAAMAQRHDGLVTIGITPTHPATGYGYVERSLPVDQGYYVERFVEKPSLEHARAYLESGRFLWNAGIFVWRPRTALKELDRHAPQIMRPLRAAVANGRVDEAFPTLPRISIDYALLERSGRVFTVQGTFGWDDVGDWIALERLVGRGATDPLNTVVGHHVGLRASGNIVYTEDPNDVVVTVGVEDLVIVKRGNTILLLRKDRIGEIKDVLADERLAALAAEAPPARETGPASPAATTVDARN